MVPKFVADIQVKCCTNRLEIRVKTDLGSKIMGPNFHLWYLMCLWGIPVVMSIRELPM